MPNPIKLCVLGPPGVGKGTQVQRLKASLRDTVSMSTGDTARQWAKLPHHPGPFIAECLKKARFIPDDIIVKMVEEFVSERGHQGWILDGFPRTVPQAQTLVGWMKNLGDQVITLHFEARREVCFARALGRGRDDDAEALFNGRYESYLKGRDAISVMAQVGPVLVINAEGTPDKVWLYTQRALLSVFDKGSILPCE